MVIQTVKNEYGEIVYHVEDERCIQEFATKREAREYIDYVKSIKIDRPDWDQLEELFGEYN